MLSFCTAALLLSVGKRWLEHARNRDDLFQMLLNDIVGFDPRFEKLAGDESGLRASGESLCLSAGAVSRQQRSDSQTEPPATSMH